MTMLTEGRFIMGPCECFYSHWQTKDKKIYKCCGHHGCTRGSFDSYNIPES